MLLGVDVGGTFTDAVLVAGGRRAHREGADDARATSRAGVMAAVRARARGAPARSAGDVEALRPRHDRRDERAARGHAARAPRSSPPRASPTWSSSAARRARDLYRLCAAHPAPLVAARAALRARPSAWAPTACCGRSSATLERARRRGRRRRARGGRRLPAALLPPPRARARARRRAAPSACRTSTSRSRTRSSARSASTSAPRRPRSTPRSRRCSRAYLRRLARARRATAGLPDPGDHAVQRRPRRRSTPRPPTPR